MTLAQLSALIDVETEIGGGGTDTAAPEPERGTFADLIGLATLASKGA